MASSFFNVSFCIILGGLVLLASSCNVALLCADCEFSNVNIFYLFIFVKMMLSVVIQPM